MGSCASRTAVQEADSRKQRQGIGFGGWTASIGDNNKQAGRRSCCCVCLNTLSLLLLLKPCCWPSQRQIAHVLQINTVTCTYMPTFSTSRSLLAQQFNAGHCRIKLCNGEGGLMLRHSKLFRCQCGVVKMLKAVPTVAKFDSAFKFKLTVWFWFCAVHVRQSVRFAPVTVSRSAELVAIARQTRATAHRSSLCCLSTQHRHWAAAKS